MTMMLMRTWRTEGGRIVERNREYREKRAQESTVQKSNHKSKLFEGRQQNIRIGLSRHKKFAYQSFTNRPRIRSRNWEQEWIVNSVPRQTVTTIVGLFCICSSCSCFSLCCILMSGSFHLVNLNRAYQSLLYDNIM